MERKEFEMIVLDLHLTKPKVLDRDPQWDFLFWIGIRSGYGSEIILEVGSGSRINQNSKICTNPSERFTRHYVICFSYIINLKSFKINLSVEGK
jgi:hypothetical protein